MNYQLISFIQKNVSLSVKEYILPFVRQNQKQLCNKAEHVDWLAHFVQ